MASVEHLWKGNKSFSRETFHDAFFHCEPQRKSKIIIEKGMFFYGIQKILSTFQEIFMIKPKQLLHAREQST